MRELRIAMKFNCQLMWDYYNPRYSSNNERARERPLLLHQEINRSFSRVTLACIKSHDIKGRH